MFKSISYLPNLYKYNKAEDIYSVEYKLIDDDFETVLVVDGAAAGDVEVEIINYYEGRGLNVAANFVLYLQYYQKKYSYSISSVVELQEKYNSKFSKYKEDIQKLLLLL